MICRGKSPGGAANDAIKKGIVGIVESEMATICMIPVEREKEFEGYYDRLLDAETASSLLGKLNIRAIIS